MCCRLSFELFVIDCEFVVTIYIKNKFHHLFVCFVSFILLEIDVHRKNTPKYKPCMSSNQKSTVQTYFGTFSYEFKDDFHQNQGHRRLALAHPMQRSPYPDISYIGFR